MFYKISQFWCLLPRPPPCKVSGTLPTTSIACRACCQCCFFVSLAEVLCGFLSCSMLWCQRIFITRANSAGCRGWRGVRIHQIIRSHCEQQQWAAAQPMPLPLLLLLLGDALRQLMAASSRAPALPGKLSLKALTAAQSLPPCAGSFGSSGALKPAPEAQS